jgi:diguanylate cyclase
VVRQNLRISDFAGRYGGDEFVIVFPYTSVEGASDCMARILSNMQKNPFHVGTEVHSVSCSAGVSSLTSQEMTADDLIRRADRALYAAKRKGRNCIVVERMGKPIQVRRVDEGKSYDER